MNFVLVIYMCVCREGGHDIKHIFYCGLRSEWFEKCCPRSWHIRSNKLERGRCKRERQGGVGRNEVSGSCEY